MKMAAWLYKSMCTPKLFDSDPSFYIAEIDYTKEVHFFDFPKRYKRGIEFYAKRYQHCNKTGFILDATPDYLTCADRVHKVYSQVGGDLLSSLKLIVILREPVSRLRSLHNHMRTMFLKKMLLKKKDRRIGAWYDQVAFANGTVMTFDQYSERVTPIRKQHIIYGKYVDHLRNWVDLFSRDQLLVLSYDEVQVDPDKVQWRIQEFLGGSFPGKLPRVNTQGGGTKTKTVSSHASQILGPLFEVKNDELYEFLDSDHRPSMQQYPFPHFHLN
jgi:hypothetical protein